jgi:hypothetical protein
MSELPDLGPQPITGGQLALYLKAKGAWKPCEACGHDDFEMCPERDGETGKARGVVWLACRQCNTVRTVLRPPIMAWLKEAKHGG